MTEATATQPATETPKADSKPGKKLLTNGGPKAKESDVAKKKREAQEALNKDLSERAQKAREEIGAILQKHNCLLIGVPKLVHVEGGRYATESECVVVAQMPKG
ncbi:MAG TPA: hypothetical protein DEH78_14325 [Solibacterales bacterium]|nr:hypothetical protein [Bryobacterales bacterium]